MTERIALCFTTIFSGVPPGFATRVEHGTTCERSAFEPFSPTVMCEARYSKIVTASSFCTRHASTDTKEKKIQGACVCFSSHVAAFANIYSTMNSYQLAELPVVLRPKKKKKAT